MVSILELEKYAKDKNIPIMEKEGIEFLVSYIKEKQIKTILEIGSAIGYSAIKMALVDPNIQIVTIERDESRYNKALENIKKFNLEKQIKIYLTDAFSIDLEQEFDMIFIDAAKSQYIKLFEKFKNNLKCNGIIISDNLKFHGLVDGSLEKLSRNVKGIVRKLRKYIEFLKNNQEFETEFLNIGDGISISRKLTN